MPKRPVLTSTYDHPLGADGQLKLPWPAASPARGKARPFAVQHSGELWVSQSEASKPKSGLIGLVVN